MLANNASCCPATQHRQQANSLQCLSQSDGITCCAVCGRRGSSTAKPNTQDNLELTMLLTMRHLRPTCPLGAARLLLLLLQQPLPNKTFVGHELFRAPRF